MFPERFIARLSATGTLPEDRPPAIAAAAFGASSFEQLLADWPSRQGAEQAAVGLEFKKEGEFFDVRLWGSVSSIVGSLLQHADALGVARESVPDLVAVGFGYRDADHMHAHYEPPFVARSTDYPRFAQTHREALGYWPLTDLLTGFVYRGHTLLVGGRGGGRLTALQYELSTSPEIRRQVLFVGTRDLPLLTEELVEVGDIRAAIGLKGGIGRIPGVTLRQLIEAVPGLAAGGYGAVVLLDAAATCSSWSAGETRELLQRADAAHVCLTFVMDLPLPATDVMGALWAAVPNRVLFPGDYDTAFPHWELGAWDDAYPGIQATLEDRLFLRLVRGESVPFQVEGPDLPGSVGTAYPWLQAISPEAPAADAPEELLAIGWEGGVPGGKVALRVRRKGDADTVEYDAVLSEDEWLLVFRVAMRKGLQPATPVEYEALLAKIKAIGYRIKAFRSAALDPNSGNLTLELTTAGAQLGLWLVRHSPFVA